MNTPAPENSGTSTHHANLTSVEDYDNHYGEDTTTQLTQEAMMEKKLWTLKMMRKNDTFSSYVALDDVTVFEAANLDAIALHGTTISIPKQVRHDTKMLPDKSGKRSSTRW